MHLITSSEPTLISCQLKEGFKNGWQRERVEETGSLEGCGKPEELQIA